ncbi:hypothetical protein D9611_001449 [Ephemerocybe angulata]|uniref:GH10 domain-containing protein n=1 Tax=Ephemerocybe angulata TaxID=980116 RepID=A0A8H5CHR1_9AGAR|nr:hypothetical protein D9611_001449 [Tulosesus angulatus]
MPAAEFSLCSLLFQKLYINDYNIEADNAKLRGLVGPVSRINKFNPGTIDAIGMQSHLAVGGSADLEKALLIASDTVKEVAVTEVDIVNAIVTDYVGVVKACVAVTKCAGVTIWGISDRDRRATLLLWDSAYKPRPAYHAIINAL